jgi:hypothetical protein
MPAPKKVDFKAVLTAHKDPTGKNVYFLDTRTGSVLNLSPTTPAAQLQAIKDRFVKEPDALLKLPFVTSEETYNDMDAFIAVVADKKLKERLRIAKSGGGTLRNFLDALQSSPREEQQWKTFREEKIQRRLKEWLKQNGVTVS